MKSTISAIALVASLCTPFAHAHAQVVVKDAWVRATVPQQQATGAFMQLTSPQNARLISASSPVTPNVEVHEMAMDNDVMKMRQVPAIELPAGKTVELKPGGYHVMLIGLKQPLKAGDTVPLTLVIERDGKRETLEVRAPVRPLNSGASAPAAGNHQH